MEGAFGDLGVFEGSMEGITEGAFLTLRLELLEGNIVRALVAAVMEPSVSGYLSILLHLIMFQFSLPGPLNLFPF